jgi:hypothetical protein
MVVGDDGGLRNQPFLGVAIGHSNWKTDNFFNIFAPSQKEIRLLYDGEHKMVPEDTIFVLPLDDAAWSMIDEAVRRLEQAWKLKPNPGFADLVPPSVNPFRKHVLVELVKVDQEQSWRMGSCQKLETYLDSWPELNQHLDTVVDLLNAECLTRAHLARLPSSEELHVRFPLEISTKINLAAIQTEVERERPQSTKQLRF